MLPSHTRPPRTRRSAYTLIELLVVVVIIVTLVAISLPLARKVLDDSRVREASRQLNGYLTMAKTRSVQMGRPCGVYFQCDPPVGDTSSGLRQVTRMYLAEVPPPYIGSTLIARAKIYDRNYSPSTLSPRPPPALPLFVPVQLTDPTLPDAGELAILYTLIEPGEQFFVRFDYKGEWYRILRGSTAAAAPYNMPANFYLVGALNGATSPLPPGYYDVLTSAGPQAPVVVTPGQPFQILRQPRRIGQPLELSGGTCIDLMYCGMGTAGAGRPIVGGTAQQMPIWGGFPADNIVSPQQQPAALQSLTIMFSPGGGMDGIYVNNLPCSPTGTVHLLIGKVDKVNPPLADADTTDPKYDKNMFDPQFSNLSDPNAVWVSIGRTNATINTSENVPPILTGGTLPNMTYSYIDQNGTSQSQTLNTNQAIDKATYVEMCRIIAAGHTQMGGR